MIPKSMTHYSGKQVFLFSACGVTAGFVLASLLFRSKKQRTPNAENSNALHDLIEGAATAARASSVGKLTTKYANTMAAPGSTYVVRIVLTGGPCAGKSSALSHIRAAGTHRGFDVVAAPEVATLILNSGYNFPDPAKPDFAEKKFKFQLAIAQLQLGMERSLLGLVGSTGRPTIVVFDRGLLDGKAYTSSEQEWSRIISNLTDSKGNPVDDAYAVGRYDGVVHMVSAADGAENFFRTGNTEDDEGKPVVRLEGIDEAKRLDGELQRCWSAHPHLVVIPNEPGSDSFERKLQRTATAVVERAQAIHPQ